MIFIARVGRKYLEASFFHTIVQGINKEYIFSKDQYIYQYLKVFNKNSQEHEVKTIAYCVMNNHAHFLVNTNEVNNLSKCMQKTNSSYAKYYNFMNDGRVGYVFKDRFLSEPITNRKYFIQCIKYIHLNPVKAHMVERCGDYKFSSYSFFVKKRNQFQENSLFSLEDYNEICEDCECDRNFLDIEKDVYDDIKNGIREFVNKYDVNIYDIYGKREILKKLIKYLKEKEKIKYVDIQNFFGISKGTMNRLKSDK